MLQPVVDQLRVGVVADEFAVREKHLARRPGVQILAHIVVGGVNAQLARLLQQHLLLHQLLAHLLLKKLHDHRIVGILRIALLQLLPRNLLHALPG